MNRTSLSLSSLNAPVTHQATGPARLPNLEGLTQQALPNGTSCYKAGLESDTTKQYSSHQHFAPAVFKTRGPTSRLGQQLARHHLLVLCLLQDDGSCLNAALPNT